MSTTRQDAWTPDEDLLLADVVIRHIRDGSTQLAAFAEVGNRLSRTAAACGFRWNSTVRKKYEDAILLAKKERKQSVKTLRQDVKKRTNQPPDITVADVVSFLQKLTKRVTELNHENERLKQELEGMKKEYEHKIDQLTASNRMLKQDYEAVIEIMERARKWAGSREEEKKENE